MKRVAGHLLSVVGIWGATACGDQQNEVAGFGRDALLDPETCRSCHPGHYDEWAGSMHAYATKDPVFLAMNARGQRETHGRLGTFCVKCHAPMAVREGWTLDGLDLEEVPEHLSGVTCYFCHNTEAIEGTHNNPLVLAEDATFFGPWRDPSRAGAHASAYAPHFDSSRVEASAFCGSCHDVTLTEPFVPNEVELERTFAEWQQSLFAKPRHEGGIGCGGCHMPASPRRSRSAETADAPARRSARHDFEGVDLALDAFAGRERQRLLAERLLASTLLAEICVSESGAIEVTLENAGAGHHFPSGASHDREAWLAVEAFDSSGGAPVFSTLAPEAADPGGEQVVFKDYAVDGEGEPAHMFWDVAEIAKSTTLPGAATRDPRDPAFHVERRVVLLNATSEAVQRLNRVTLTVKVRPIGLAILEDLVESGDLDASTVEAMPVLAALPNRCYDEALRERHPDILGARSSCDDPALGEYTLVWQDSDANETNPNYRVARVNDTPARCLSHPSYVAIPANP